MWTQDHNFLFLFLNFDSLLEFNSRKNCWHLTNWTRWNKRNKVWSSTTWPFHDIFVAIALLLLLFYWSELTGKITGGMVISGFSFTRNGWCVTVWVCSSSTLLPSSLFTFSPSSFSSCNFLQKAVSSAIVFPPAFWATLTCCEERVVVTGLSVALDTLFAVAVFVFGFSNTPTVCVWSFDLDFERDLVLFLSFDVDLLPFPFDCERDLDLLLFPFDTDRDFLFRMWDLDLDLLTLDLERDLRPLFCLDLDLESDLERESLRLE